mgnify:CR=1 FL=1
MPTFSDAPFTFRYPLKVANDGGLAVDYTVVSQVRLLFTVSPGQRIDDVSYGMPAQQFEQSHLQLDAGRLLILLAVQRALLRFVPEISLTSIDAFRDVAARRLVVDVIFRDKTDFQLPQRILLGLGFANG